MGRDNLIIQRPGLVAELRGPEDFMSQAGEMTCLVKGRWKRDIDPESAVENESLIFLNFSPEEQWDTLIQEFSSEFYRLCSRYSRSNDAVFRDFRRFDPALRFRVAGTPDSDTSSGTDPIPLTNYVRVIQSKKPDSPYGDLSDGTGRLDVFIESGWAFGTGSHPSTVCSVMAMERLRSCGMFNRQTRVLDMGTGTGILAILAALMGAGEVTAVDIDPEALHFARHNTRANGVDDIVKIIPSHKYSQGCSMRNFDICLANLTMSVASILLPGMTSDLKPHGLLMLSGFKQGAAGTVLDLLSRHGLWKNARFSSSSWCSVLAGHDRSVSL